MSKIDLKRELKEFYRASAKKPSIVDVPEGKFTTIIGRGAPGGPAYKAARAQNYYQTTNGEALRLS